MRTVLFNPSNNLSLRRALRKQGVAAENILWGKLRNNRIGFRFRRQYGIGTYIVDFYCPAIRLAIEIDGATHERESELRYDIERQEWIEKFGIEFLRFTNTDVKMNIEGVVARIREVCEGRRSRPLPNPLPFGSAQGRLLNEGEGTTRKYHLSLTLSRPARLRAGS
jgi:very-short-patch-repair endonuclease